MANYARTNGESKLAWNLQRCGHFLMFRDYFTVGKVRLHAAKFCNKHLLCPLCAIRRGAKMVKAYMDRLAVIKQNRPELKAFLVTLTVKDAPDLGLQFQHLFRSVQKLHKTRSGKRQYSEACKADGAVWSYEIKRGKNSGQWHAHMHAVWLCEEAPDAHALSKQWHAITGDSYIVDVTPFHDQDDLITGFLEVFKYALKFSDMPLEDNWEAFHTLAGRRLIASFGSFRGVDVPEDLTDEKLEELPYIELLFKYAGGAGYTLLSASQAKPAERIKRPTGPPPTIIEEKPYESLHLRKLKKKYG